MEPTAIPALPGGSAVTEAVSGLLAALRRGDDEAFRRVAAAEVRDLYALAWGILGRRDEAEDACQEVLLRLYRAAPKLSPDTSLRAWLRRVCINYCLDERRRRTRREVREAAELTWPNAGAWSPQEAAERTEFRARLHRALAFLPPGQRAVFVLRHVHECSVKETAHALGCAEGTVKAHLSRAVRRLRQLLGESGVGLDAESTNG